MQEFMGLQHILFQPFSTTHNYNLYIVQISYCVIEETSKIEDCTQFCG